MIRIIVCDTGPLLHLSEIGAIHFLSLAGDVLIPPQVAVEFENNAQGWSPPQWAKVVDLDKPTRQKAEMWVKESRIDAGEAEAICTSKCRTAKRVYLSLVYKMGT